MPTTGGDWALVSEKAVKNATIVQRCLDAGMIVIGKANLTVSSVDSSIHDNAGRYADTQTK